MTSFADSFNRHVQTAHLYYQRATAKAAPSKQPAAPSKQPTILTGHAHGGHLYYHNNASHARHHNATSWTLCDGDISTPGQRNRTCFYGNLLFRDSRFHFIGGGKFPNAGVHLHNRFGGGMTTGLSSRSYFSPLPSRPEITAAGAKVMSTPLFIGGDIHGNIGHNMLDCIFPAFATLSRLKAVAKLRNNRHALAAIPAVTDLLNDDVTSIKGDSIMFLLYDPPQCCPGWHRGRPERRWLESVAGGGVVDLPELSQQCGGNGCLFQAAWSGIGHTGLSLVDRDNVFGGAREYRALFAYRKRIYGRFGVPLSPGPPPSLLAAPDEKNKPLLVVIVQQKRMVTNLPQLANEVMALAKGHTGVLAGREVIAKVIRWEAYSFVEQLRLLNDVSVQVAGVGTAQMNSYLLPVGSVALCLGWRHDQARTRIEYFDSHVLNSLDHVRALYYPSYSSTELVGPSAVTLDLKKAGGLVISALELAVKGFNVPIPKGANMNNYDKAFAWINDKTNDRAMQARTGDDDFASAAGPRCVANGVATMLWGQLATKGCPWQPYVREAIEKFGL